ncbi:MAG TPA: hypothetical protein VFW33_16205 [Gemmataceae bacterium]|nr:hypothetical protein [Gemmataceae bacterium]
MANLPSHRSAAKPKLLRHATLSKHIPSILRHGLLCSKSKGKKPVVWACEPDQAPWACLHTVRRHGGRVQQVVVLEVSIPRNQLRRHGGSTKGLYYTAVDVPVESIRSIITFGELSRSPVEAAR